MLINQIKIACHGFLTRNLSLKSRVRVASLFPLGPWSKRLLLRMSLLIWIPNLNEVSSAGFFSGAVLVTHKGTPLFEGAVGMADRDRNIPSEAMNRPLDTEGSFLVLMPMFSTILSQNTRSSCYPIWMTQAIMSMHIFEMFCWHQRSASTRRRMFVVRGARSET